MFPTPIESGLVRTSQSKGFFLSPPAHIVPKALYLSAEDLALIHQSVDIGVRLFLELAQRSQARTMAIKTAAVSHWGQGPQ